MLRNKPLVRNGFIDERELYHGLFARWPQINHKTRIELVRHHEIKIEDVQQAFYPKPELVNKSGWRARCWRTLGELLNLTSWKQRGKEYVLSPTVPQARVETVQLEQLGCTLRNGESMSLYCTYHPRTDTFFVFDYVTEFPK